MITIDSSALIAILLDEPEKSTFVRLIESTKTCLSPINFVEAGMVAMTRREAGLAKFDALLADLGVTIHPADAAQARLARDTYRRYGKGNHHARLNLGDCFAYALAQAMNAPLLYKGDDFAKTDIANALAT